MRPLVATLVVTVITLFSQLAQAGRCDIFNDTGTSFLIESGNTSNQRVSAHTHTSIASGKIIAKSDDGKGVGGSCNDGDKIKIVLDSGVYIIRPN
jgi:hypothetical protein